MRGVLTGFVTIWGVIGVGWLIERFRLLGPHARPVLARLAFFITTPALLFTTLAAATPAVMITPTLAVFVLSAGVTAALYVALATLVWRSGWGELAIGTLSVCYVNLANLGIPIAAYVLGDVSVVVPILLFQFLVAAPVAVTVLESQARHGGADAQQTRSEPRRGSGVTRWIGVPLRNPILTASALGLALAVTGWRPPVEVMRPIDVIGSAAVPVALLVLGMSLNDGRPWEPGPAATPRYTVVALKAVVQPAVAYLIGRYLFDLSGTSLLAAVLIAALPTGQNVFVFASRYGRGEALARDVVMLSTLVATVCLSTVAYVLG